MRVQIPANPFFDHFNSRSMKTLIQAGHLCFSFRIQFANKLKVIDIAHSRSATGRAGGPSCSLANNCMYTAVIVLDNHSIRRSYSTNYSTQHNGVLS